MSFKGLFSNLSSSGCHSVEWNCYSNFGARPSEKEFCKNILKSIHPLERNSHFKGFFLF